MQGKSNIFSSIPFIFSGFYHLNRGKEDRSCLFMQLDFCSQPPVEWGKLPFFTNELPLLYHKNRPESTLFCNFSARKCNTVSLHEIPPQRFPYFVNFPQPDSCFLNFWAVSAIFAEISWEICFLKSGLIPA